MIKRILVFVILSFASFSTYAQQTSTIDNTLAIETANTLDDIEVRKTNSTGAVMFLKKEKTAEGKTLYKQVVFNEKTKSFDYPQAAQSCSPGKSSCCASKGKKKKIEKQ